MKPNMPTINPPSIAYGTTGKTSRLGIRAIIDISPILKNMKGNVNNCVAKVIESISRIPKNSGTNDKRPFTRGETNMTAIVAKKLS
jgi:hypothetical protein